MAKVIIFSRTFPKYHDKAGLNTYFVEKFLRSMELKKIIKMDLKDYKEINGRTHQLNYFFGKEQELQEIDLNHVEYALTTGKNQTIRSGKRWNAGDLFSPRVWSDKPYQSKQIILEEDQLVEKVYDIEIYFEKRVPVFEINGVKLKVRYAHDFIAVNDGLTTEELFSWFFSNPKFQKEGKFSGQIICWNAPERIDNIIKLGM